MVLQLTLDFLYVYNHSNAYLCIDSVHSLMASCSYLSFSLSSASASSQPTGAATQAAALLAGQQLASNNPVATVTQQQAAAAAGLPQLITNAQGQIVAIGAPQVISCVLGFMFIICNEEVEFPVYSFPHDFRDSLYSLCGTGPAANSSCDTVWTSPDSCSCASTSS